ncbi:MAG: dimethylarginine dimethylaminohydrolase family protein [Actinomycetota bacterium]
MTVFTHAIVRPPGASFAEGLTTQALGAPDLDLALAQHDAYCRALEAAGVELVRLPADERFPDSTFVEDTAVVTARGVVITRPGAPSRAGETEAIAEVFARLGAPTATLEPPGTVDGGDVCQLGERFLIGRSDRTDDAGAAALAERLAAYGHPASTATVPADAFLHLKSGMSWLGEGRVAVVDELAALPELAAFERIRVAPEEAYAANCIRVNDVVIVPAGFPRFVADLRAASLEPLEVEVSEFRKQDGGVSCLSLRLPPGLIDVR